MNLFGWWPCLHDSVGWPQLGWQVCLDCGARRRYRRIGTKPGPWIKEVQVIYAEKEERAARNLSKPDEVKPSAGNA